MSDHHILPVDDDKDLIVQETDQGSITLDIIRRLEDENIRLKTQIEKKQVGTNAWSEAAIAWEVAASIHTAYARGKDTFFKVRNSDFKRYAAECRTRAEAERILIELHDVDEAPVYTLNPTQVFLVNLARQVKGNCSDVISQKFAVVLAGAVLDAFDK
jgi:hypothetical protein